MAHVRDDAQEWSLTDPVRASIKPYPLFPQYLIASPFAPDAPLGGAGMSTPQGTRTTFNTPDGTGAAAGGLGFGDLIKAAPALFKGLTSLTAPGSPGTRGDVGGIGNQGPNQSLSDTVRPVDNSTNFAGNDPEAGLAPEVTDAMPDGPIDFSGSPDEGTGVVDTLGSGGDAAGGMSFGDVLGYAGPLLGLGAAALSNDPGKAIGNWAAKTALQQGGKYLANETGLTDWLGSTAGNLWDSALAALGLGGAEAAGAAGGGAAGGAIGAELAGAGFEGGLGGAAAGAAGGAGLGLLGGGLLSVPFIAAAFAPHAANSPTGFRPEGWSKYISQQRTQQHHIADVADTYLQGATDQLANGADPNGIPGITQFLSKVSNPDDPLNRGFYSVVDRGPELGAADTTQRVGNDMKTMYNTYGDTLNPVDKTRLAMTINSRDPNANIKYDTLQPDQINNLSWEQQLRYRDFSDPGWRDRLATGEGTPDWSLGSA